MIPTAQRALRATCSGMLLSIAFISTSCREGPIDRAEDLFGIRLGAPVKGVVEKDPEFCLVAPEEKQAIWQTYDEVFRSASASSHQKGFAQITVAVRASRVVLIGGTMPAEGWETFEMLRRRICERRAGGQLVGGPTVGLGTFTFETERKGENAGMLSYWSRRRPKELSLSIDLDAIRPAMGSNGVFSGTPMRSEFPTSSETTTDAATQPSAPPVE